MYLKVGSDTDALNLSKLLNDGNWMVLYYAEWCGHCKTMKPEWQNVVKKFNNPQYNTNNVNVAEIESEHIDKLVHKPEIQGFPTIKMYNRGKPVANFEEERVASKIEEFANNNAKPTVIKKAVHPLHKAKNASKMELQMNQYNLSNSKNTDSKINNIINSIESIKPKDNEINEMNNLIESNLIESNPIEKKPFEIGNHQNILNLPCTSIRKAKPCKNNPKCMYDGTDFKCKDKIFKPNTGNMFNNKIANSNIHKNNMVGNIIFKNASKHRKHTQRSHTPRKHTQRSHTPRSHKPHKHETRHKKNKHHSKPGKTNRNKSNSNIRKTTKSVFDKLINSFGHIGNEARKDSKLLKEASNKLA